MTSARTQTTKEYSLQDLLQPDGGKASVFSDSEALAFCVSIARSHYENFPVASILLPRAMRTPICVVYAFARTADDVSDEDWTHDRQRKTQALAFMRSLARTPEEYPHHPIARALGVVRRTHDVPADPLERLVSAFAQDVAFERFTTWDAFLEYCTRSANPVGELMLRIAGDATDASIRASNDICTALQIVNMLQDLSIDLARGRSYLPIDPARPEDIRNACHRVATLFRSGSPVTRYVRSWRLRMELHMIIAGGRAILAKCEQSGPLLRQQRPLLTTSDYVCTLFRS